MAGKRPRVIWSGEETKTFIDLMAVNNVLTSLDEKKERVVDIFKQISTGMERKGFTKSVNHLRTKWKHLKTEFYKQRQGIINQSLLQPDEHNSGVPTFG